MTGISFTDDNLEKRLDEFPALCSKISEKIGPLLKRGFSSGAIAQRKDAASPIVTELDLKCEKVLREILIQDYPEDEILGEELPAREGTNSYSWVIDPIDGTIGFQTGKPMFATLLALVYQEKPVAGWIYQPVLEHSWIGRQGKELISSVESQSFPRDISLKDSVISSTTPAMFSTPLYESFFHRLCEEVWITSFGGDAYQYGLLAQGRIDLVVENQMAWHDFAALVPVIESAGGQITDFEGNPLRKESPGEVLASLNPNLHEEAIQIFHSSKEMKTR